jgi:two-component system, OmpR family, sensor kinase
MPGSSMRILTFSLIAAVLAATIGLGWLLDSLFYHFADAPSGLSSDNIVVLEELGQDLAMTLNVMAKPQEFVQSWHGQGRYVTELVPLTDIQLPAPLIQQVVSGEPLLLTNNNQISLYYFLPKHQSLLLLKPTFSTEHLDGREFKLVLTLLFYSALIALLWMWAYPLVSRLMNLRNTAQLFGKGQLQQRIKVGSVSYVKDLENEFNHMAQRIENLVSDVKLIGNAVSHDLRTPLARMRFGIDTIAEEEDPQQQAKYLQRLGNDVDEMTHLVGILLDFARLDQAMIQLDKQQVDLVPLIESSIKNKQGSTRQLVFVAPANPYIVCGDEKYLTIALNNVLQNAIQYCRNQLVVELSILDNQICIKVSDDGEGFNDNLQDMLKPFVRGKTSGKNVQGYGMGLAIVQRIVEWHKGELSLGKSIVLGGAQVSIYLPRDQ